MGFTKTLTGFVDPTALSALASRMTAASERPFDIVYRATKLPYWFGSHGQLKHGIAEAVEHPARAAGLRTDISTRWEDTIFGSNWLDFIMSGRATIGAESGSSVLDAVGTIQLRIKTMLAADPELTFDEVDRRLPAGWDSYTFFAISPRHLEAVMTKTCQVLIEGDYSGVLEPNRHYIPLRRNFSNLDEVLDRLHDVDACAEIADTAYREVLGHVEVTLPRLAEDIRRAARVPGRRKIPARVPIRVARTLRSPFSITATTRSRATAFATATRLWLTIASTLAKHPVLAELVAGWPRRNPRPPLRRLAGDVLRLGILERLRRETASGPAHWWISARVTEGVLQLRSEYSPPDPSRLTVTEPFTRIIWDHSAVGNSIPLASWDARPDVTLDDRGRYSFDAIAALGETDPALLTRVLRDFEPA
jgi:hypothetical protein